MRRAWTQRAHRITALPPAAAQAAGTSKPPRLLTDVVHAHDTDHLVLELRWSTECGKRVAGSRSMATAEYVAAGRESVAAARSGEAFGSVAAARSGEAFLGAPLRRYEAHKCVWPRRARVEAARAVRGFIGAKRCRNRAAARMGGGGTAVVEVLCDAAETCRSTLSVPTP